MVLLQGKELSGAHVCANMYLIYMYTYICICTYYYLFVNISIYYKQNKKDKYIDICKYMYVYLNICRLAFQGVVRLCRGLPGHSQRLTVPVEAGGTFRAQGLTVPSKYVDIGVVCFKFIESKSHNKSLVCRGECEVMQPF